MRSVTLIDTFNSTLWTDGVSRVETFGYSFPGNSKTIGVVLRYFSRANLHYRAHTVQSDWAQSFFTRTDAPFRLPSLLYAEIVHMGLPVPSLGLLFYVSIHT